MKTWNCCCLKEVLFVLGNTAHLVQITAGLGNVFLRSADDEPGRFGSSKGVRLAAALCDSSAPGRSVVGT